MQPTLAYVVHLLIKQLQTKATTEALDALVAQSFFVPPDDPLFQEIIKAIEKIANKKGDLKRKAGFLLHEIQRTDIASDPADRGDMIRKELRQMITAIDSIIQSMKVRLNTLLPLLQGVMYTDYEQSADLISLVNGIRTRLQLGWRMGDGDETRVNVRCVNSPRSKGGIYQTVTTTSKPDVLYNGKAFPLLGTVETKSRKIKKREN